MTAPLIAALLFAGSSLAGEADGEGKSFVLELSRGDVGVAAARFDATMTKAVPQAELDKLWKNLIGKFGEFKGIERVDVDRVDGYRRDTVICNFAHGKTGLRVVVGSTGSVAGLFIVPAASAAEPAWTPPPYVDSSKFEERLVKVGSVELPGRLCVPKGRTKFPVVVFVWGSGPNDMDESFQGIKIFRDLAQGLASRGIATLRFDKRTYAHKGKVETVVDEYVDDTTDAVKLASTLQGAEKVIVLGHSQGATLAPRIAKGNPSVAGLIMLAGSSWPFPKVIVEQLEYQRKKGHLGDHGPDLIAAARAEARKWENPALKPDDKLEHGITGANVLDLRRYDAVAAASQLEIPIFMGWGELDLKVIPDDFAGWKAKLGGRKNVTIHTYRGLQHLFTPVGTPEVDHVSPTVVDDIVRWISA